MSITIITKYGAIADTNKVIKDNHIDWGTGVNQIQNIQPNATPTFAGLTISALTAGSVLFAGANGLISQNNADLFWDNANKRLGIGTNTPSYKLDVAGHVSVGGRLWSQDLRVAEDSQITALRLYGSVIPLFNTDLYQDFLQFNPPNLAEYKSGGTWYQTTVPSSLFRGGTIGSETITNGWEGYRLTWTSFPNRHLENLFIAVLLNNHSLTVTLETSANGTDWTNIFTSSPFSFAKGYFSYQKFLSTADTPYLRVTITPTWNPDYPTYNIVLYNIRYFGANPVYGKIYLYKWDENRNFQFYGNVGIGKMGESYQLELTLDSAAKPSTSTWTVLSDARLKESIEPADLKLCYEAVKKIPLKYYRFRDDVYTLEQVKDRGKLGWIADDVEDVYPKSVNVIPRFELLKGQPVYDEAEGELKIKRDTIEDVKCLNVDQIYASMYGALQFVIQKLEKLEAEVYGR